MSIKKLHFFSGLTITIFVGIHLFNHVWSIFGAEAHIELMNIFRLFYRNIFVEIILLSTVLVQIISGIKLFIVNKKIAVSHFEKLQ